MTILAQTEVQLTTLNTFLLLANAVIVLVTGVIGLAKISQVHQLVNSTNSQLLERVEQLTIVLGVSDQAIPPTPKGPEVTD